MIFIDSWIWLEFFLEGKKFQKTKEILQKIKAGEDAIISTVVLTEVRYRIAKKFGIERADEALYLIENFPHLKIIPVISEVAKLAAYLRLKYYKKPDKVVSFADMINLATAVLTNCKKLYSGDPDFKVIEEIETEIV